MIAHRHGFVNRKTATGDINRAVSINIFLFILLPLKENSFAEKYLLISLQVT
uniref:Uncharacterized protein n=1 Tax=Klebsiella pneumoniae TaxID=573 RepID=A0A2P1BPN7_KLEPN|nr:hypothetical protein [Klebsiella pneumoniae]